MELRAQVVLELPLVRVVALGDLRRGQMVLKAEHTVINSDKKDTAVIKMKNEDLLALLRNFN